MGDFVWPSQSEAASRTAEARFVVEPDGTVTGCLPPARIVSPASGADRRADPRADLTAARRRPSRTLRLVEQHSDPPVPAFHGDQPAGVERQAGHGPGEDNAAPFALDDIDELGDDELYRRLPGELPDPLRAARGTGIVAWSPGPPPSGDRRELGCA